MSLNTKDRYQYIYGNNVRKLEAVEPERRMPAASPQKKNRPKHNARSQALDWKYSMITWVGIILCAVGAMGYVRETVYIQSLNKQIVQLKNEKNLLEGKREALQCEINKRINLEEITDYALNELGMDYPDSDHIITYSAGSNDYFRQYESVYAAKNR